VFSITVLPTNENSLANSQPAKNLLKENEAIINPYYMQQLLEYSIKLAGEGGLDAQSLLKDAEVLSSSFNKLSFCLILFVSVSCKNSRQFNTKNLSVLMEFNRHRT